MDSCYIGAIMPWAVNFAPLGWAFCNGQSLPVAQNNALYALIGNTYGGNTTNFNLPDLRGRIPLGAGGTSPWGVTYTLGAVGGTEKLTLSANNLAPHTHPVSSTAVITSGTSAEVSLNIGIPVNTDAYDTSKVTNTPGTTSTLGIGKTSTSLPTNIYTSNNPTQGATLKPFTAQGNINVPTPSVSVNSTCNNNATSVLPIDTRQPFLCINYIICIMGLFPPRD